MHITLKAICSWEGNPKLHRQPLQNPSLNKAKLSPLIHYKHGQTHEMRPASGDQGLFNENFNNVAIIPFFSSKQDSITELSNDT